MSTREVTLDGGSPWGFRMHGGADSQQPLRIARVNPGSKASQRGIREGDLISSINGQSTRAITNSEAHALLKNAGDTLVLGLNQETNGSPKRRVQKVVYESKEENSKGTGITSTSSTTSNITTINRTITNSQQSNETTRTNGVGHHHKSEAKNSESSNFTSYIKNGTPYTTPRGATDGRSRDGPNDDNDIARNRSIRSNESDIVVDSVIAATRDKPLLLAAVIMPDNVCGSSRSRNKRRSRSHRKKAKKCTAVTPHTPPDTELETNNKNGDETNHETKVNELSASATTTTPVVTSIHIATEHHIIDHEVDRNEPIESEKTNKSATKNIIHDGTTKNEQSAAVSTISTATETIVEEQAVSDYKVEFPMSDPVNKKTNNNNMVKSRSLDDDEKVKITELTDEEPGAVVSVSASTAIVSEADSDVEWEVVADLAMQKKNSGQQFGTMSVISLPLEEHVTYETSHVSPEDERSLRDFLEGLDLVSSPEESVKRIEKPTTTETVKMKRAKKRAALVQHFLPYFENPRYLDVISEEGSDLSDRDSKHLSTSYRSHVIDNIDDNDDDVFEDIQTKLQNKFQTYYAGVNDGAILVGTKLIDHKNTTSPVKEATFSTSMTETASGAEVVYLDDSSESMTPSDLLDLEDNTADLDADDEEDISVDLEKSCSDSLDIELAAAENLFLIKSDNSVTSSSSTISRDAHLTHNEGIKSESAHKVSPPIPNTFTNDNAEESLESANIKTIDFIQTALAENNSSENVDISAKENESLNVQEDIKRTSDENKIIANEIIDFEKFSESEEELNKELKNLFECWNRPEQDYKTSQIDAAATKSPSRSNSASSARSSRSTSQCTAVYNPLHSSLTNIAAALRESAEDAPTDEPAPLREICVRTLLAMPFGKDIIEELATVSLSLEEMTCRTPSHLQTNQSQILQSESVPEPKHKSSTTSHDDKSDTDNTSVLLADNPIVRDASLAMEKGDREHEHWIGMPTEENPNLLVCLSPSQKEFIDKTKSFPNEADSLLDLHRKYIERRGYHEDYEYVPMLATNKDTPSFKIKSESINNNNDCRINYNDYIKKFTREIPIQIIKSDYTNQHSKNGNLRYDTYIKQVTREVPIQVEKQINKPVNNKIYSAALSDDNNEKNASTSSNQRLRARHLGEWLNLARNESDRINILNEHTRKVHNLHSSVNKLVSQRSCEDRSPNSMEPQFTRDASARRYSLPFILYEQQMEYILEKEREIELEIEKLKQEKSKLENNHSPHPTLNPSLILTNITQPPKQFNAANYQISRKGDIAILNSETPILSPINNATNMATEKFRQEMYNEYMCKIAERQERKHNKVIKIQISQKTKPDETDQSAAMSPQYEVKHVCGIEDEFMNKVREKKSKLGVDETEEDDCETSEVTSSVLPPVKIMDGSLVKETSQLPKHLQEFVDYTASVSATDDVARRICRALRRNTRISGVIGNSLLHEIDSELVLAQGFLLSRGVWSPGKSGENIPIISQEPPQKRPSPPKDLKCNEPAPVVWTPRSAGSSPTADRKEFRPVSFESPVLSRKIISKETTPVTTPDSAIPLPPPWQGGQNFSSSSTTQETLTSSSTVTTSLEQRKLTTSHSAPIAGLNSLGKLPRAPNPTITLLQKAREGQLPRGASYIEEHQPQQNGQKPRSKDGKPPLIGPGEILYTVKNEYMSESDSEKPKKMADLGPRKFEGIGPTTKDGMPIVLRSEVKDSNQAKWYKRMYDTLHRAKPDDEYVTVRYKTRRGRYPYTSAAGYLSEPEPNAYDSDAGISASKYATLDRRRMQPTKDKENEYITYTVPRNKYGSSSSVKHSTDVYKNQPGRIENYVTGHSSISEKEAKEWWDEVMEIFDGHLEQQKHVPPSRSYMSHALKESGYESDSTLVFRRREDAALQLSPLEQKEAYKTIQKGGEVPLHGLRKLAPERPKDDSEIEYFPISPTLTRIRIHKNMKPINEILCYPVTVHHQPPSQIFSTYKRTAPSSSSMNLSSSQVPQPPRPPLRPPSPPKRRSSRNSHTLRLVSTMTVHHSPNPKSSTRRHETCFRSSKEKSSNVKFLRDRISYKLRSPTSSHKNVKSSKTISTYPSTSKESIVTTSTIKEPKPFTTNTVKSKIDSQWCKKDHLSHHYSRGTASSTAKRCCRYCSFSVPSKACSTESIKQSDKISKTRAVSLERTFGTEKRKVDLTLPKTSDIRLKLVKSPDLISPTEVKKSIQKQKELLTDKRYPPGTTIKKSTSLFSSAKNRSNKFVAKPEEKSLNVTVAFSSKGKELLNPRSISSPIKPTSPTMSRTSRQSGSPVPSNISDKSKTSSKSRTVSTESLQSPLLKKKSATNKPAMIFRLKSTSTIPSKDELSAEKNKKKSRKIKKDQSNEEIKKEKKSLKIKDSRVKNDTTMNKLKKCAGRAAGVEFAKKLKKLDVTTVDNPKKITAETIEKHQKDIFQSDSFFQHLFLRDALSSPTPSIASKSSYILEKSRMLENCQTAPFYSEPTIGALKVYLTHRKPVTDSKFKTLDREIMRSRSVSPYGLSRSYSEQHRFDSISEVSNEEYYYDNRYGSQDSFKNRRSSSLPAKIIFSQTSRPVSPCVERNINAARYIEKRSPSTSPIRSPSQRKINSIRPPTSQIVEGKGGIQKKPIRARSAGEAESLRRELALAERSVSPSVSSVSLSHLAGDPHEYKTYVTELRHSARKSDRFKELNRFYSSLERLSQLEMTTSSTDLRPRRRFEEEIIDYDRWMQVRTRERAEQEFNNLYRKLKQEEKEKDLLFKPKYVEQFKWKSDREFGLKIKEKSVENIKEQFEKLKILESPLEVTRRRFLNYEKDVYKPLWRGNSVLNLVSQISEKRSLSEPRQVSTKQKVLSAERMLTREIGSKVWSSLSVDQVSALKNQLAEIYSQGLQQRKDDYSITVDPNSKLDRPSTLIIRRNSATELSTKKADVKKPVCTKAASIGTLSSGQTLSESEKKRLSQSLCREVQNRMSQRRKYKSSVSIILGKETRGAIAAADAKVKPVVKDSETPRTYYSLGPTEEYVNNTKAEKDFLLIRTKDESEDQKAALQHNLNKRTEKPNQSEKLIVVPKKVSSTSETESASSDTSTKTAIFVGDKKEDLNKKIEYFERGTEETFVPTIYKPAEPEDDVDAELSEFEAIEKSESPIEKREKGSTKLISSQSYADLKELFGERDLIKFATIPLSATRKQSYSSPKRPLLRVTNISPIRTLSEASSRESLIRSRSVSPDTERFWNAYLTLIKGVDVRKLTEKFETLQDFYSNRSVGHLNRRWRSDPDLVMSSNRDEYEFGDVYWLRNRFENLSRGRSRIRRHGKSSPIPKTSLKAEDRLMPHINIISKLASLYPKSPITSEEKQRSAEDLTRSLGCSIGEVEKLKEKFESPERNVSLLGHMFTSSPNMHELRDIAPYLAGPWIAHQYPRFQDNSRSASSPEKNGCNKPLKRRDRPRPKSASPPRVSKPPSILKSHLQPRRDIFANQLYNPTIHRPICRYQPTSPKADRSRSWSPVAKHTVTFKEPVMGPTPPPKGQHFNRDIGPESPRKYVEDEVTIHYRSPVRHEIKEALSEEELARRQAEAMRRIYQEERRRKYLQELQDMNSRRHTDNFIPSQKSPIPLNRYDDFIDDLSPKMKLRDRSPEPRLVARALYNFVGQSSRELTFRKGDVIFIRRQVDKNWYEGEHNAMIGLFPTSYVEIVPYDGIKTTPRKANEGQARAKFNFIAQTQLELSLAKGELVVLTRRVDDNWFEGRIGNRKGIFPVSYVEVLIDPSDKQDITLSISKPVASPAAHSMLLNGSAGGKESMGSHHYQPSYTSQANTTSYHAKPVNVIGTTTSYSSITRSQKITTGPAVNEALHIDTHSEPVPYRALYKYRPQNDDELELHEGDTVFVLEKCDDGWYVGSSQRTGAFGTFPGNYVERI